MLATALDVGGLTLYACTTENDFTGMGPYLLAALLAFTVGITAMRLVCMFGVCPPMTYQLFALAGVVLAPPLPGGGPSQMQPSPSAFSRPFGREQPGPARMNHI